MKNLRLSTITKDGFFQDWEINHNSCLRTDIPLAVNVAGSTSVTDKNCINYNKCGRLDYYFIFLVSGELHAKIGHEVVDFYQNDIIIIPPNTPYTIFSTKFPFSYLCVHFTGSRAFELLAKYDLKLFPQINHLAVGNSVQIRFNSLFDAFSKNDKYREKELSLLLERIFIEASRGAKSKSRGSLLSKSISFINEFYTTSIKIPYLASLENMCMTTYNLHFKRLMGMSPTKYILTLRMELAAELLKTSDMLIGEIGRMCGYDDVNFFSRSFKAYAKTSPSEYKRKFNVFS
ncbi:MAG: helix-turn-helix transcriptional regulator [Clostridia bacterium]|nr:helix-turn-helix transcriptional regulator [Clostridia bacterium]